jgi:hypothetical protein
LSLDIEIFYLFVLATEWMDAGNNYTTFLGAPNSPFIFEDPSGDMQELNMRPLEMIER